MPAAILNGIHLVIHAVIPAMMNPKHIHANIRAVTASRFTSAEIHSIRAALAENPNQNQS